MKTIFEQHLTNASGQKGKIKSGHNCFTEHPENPRSSCVIKHHSTWNVQCSNMLLDSTTAEQSSNDTVIRYAICYVPCLCQQETSFTLGARKEPESLHMPHVNTTPHGSDDEV